MTARAPKRLSDDPTTSSGLRVALRASDDELPSAEELARVRAALSSRVGELVRQVEVASDGEPQPTPAPVKSSASAAPRRGAWALALLVLVLAVSTYLVSR